MKAIVVTELGRKRRIFEVEQLPTFYKVIGTTKDYSKERSQGALCHRAELDNQFILQGFHGPMWDGDKIRYEDWATYDALSQ